MHRPALVALGLASGCGVETHGTRAGLVPFDGSPVVIVDSGAQFVPDSGSNPQPDADAGDMVVDPNACDMTGAYALRANLDVKWEGTSIGGVIPVLAMGQGTLQIDTLLEVVRVSGVLRGQVRVCGVRTPDFASTTIGETYAVRFPEAMWQSGSMPNWQLPLTAACEEPGCSLEADPLLAFLGLSLGNPEGPWPTSRNDPSITYYDHDEDGFAGLTVTTLGPETNTPAGVPYERPLVLGGWEATRATKIMLAIRFATHFKGAIDDCDHFAGTGSDNSVDVRATACTYASAAGDIACDPAQADFVDGNLPAWEVLSAHWAGIRLAPGADCADARAANP